MVKKFVITGTMLVKGYPTKAADGEVVSYKLKDGRRVRLVAALEIESADGTKCTYASTDAEMRKVGFEIESYDQTDFQ